MSTTSHMIDEAREVAAGVGDYPADRFSGRGIVTCAGGSYFPTAYANVRAIRELGCDWPVEWFYLPGEMDEESIGLLAPLGVRCIQRPWARLASYAKASGGWQLKPWAILHSSFEEVLFVDADSFLCRHPEELFIGRTVFWPDKYDFDGAPRPWLPDGAKGVWDAFGVDPAGDIRQIESGQLVVYKRTGWRSLNLVEWYNENWHYYWNYCYGDKDTFQMAWRFTGEPFLTVPGYCTYEGGMYVQHWTDGLPAFYHLIGSKLLLSGRPRMGATFPWRQFTVRAMADLRRTWSGAEGVVCNVGGRT